MTMHVYLARNPLSITDTLPTVLQVTQFPYAFLQKLLKSCKNSFWLGVFSAFLELRKCIENQYSIVSPVWLNESICINNKNVFYKQWLEKVYVKYQIFTMTMVK